MLQHERRSKAALSGDEGSASARGGCRIVLGELRHQAQGSTSPAVARGHHGVVGSLFSIAEIRTGGLSVLFILFLLGFHIACLDFHLIFSRKKIR